MEVGTMNKAKGVERTKFVETCDTRKSLRAEAALSAAVGTHLGIYAPENVTCALGFSQWFS